MKMGLDKIDSFNNYPFKVKNDESLKELMESIKENGLLYPLIVREKENNRYELISGHRREFALKLLGIKEAEIEIKNLADAEAIFICWILICIEKNYYHLKKHLPTK